MQHSVKISGLTTEQVNERIRQGLQNKASAHKSKTISRILIENVFSVFNIIILSIIIFLLTFYFILGDKRLFYDSIGVTFVIILNTCIAVFQEIKAKHALDKVSLLLKKEVNVIRDGKPVSIGQGEIVVDDVISVERGDQVAVDGKVIEGSHFEIDESLLTGESHPVIKKKDDIIMSGSFCVSGNGIYVAEKVGDNSYASEITKMAKKFKLNVSPLQKRLNFIVKILFAIAVFLVLLEIVKEPTGFGDADFIRKLSTILLSLVPQGLVLMSSVTFALGVYRISKIGAIIQKLNAIESFSNVQVVCTDKTGTLTQNKLTVNQINLLNDNITVEETQKLLGAYAKYSSDKNATLRTLEPFPADENAKVIDEMPFSSEKKMSMLKLIVNGEESIFILGGFDILIEKSEVKGKADIICNEKNLKVYRNVLFGKVISDKSLEEIQNNFNDIKIEPICIVSITDQVRADVMDAINLFHKNNIDIKILSGDAAFSIQAVAKEIGWDIKDDELISGDEIDEVKEENLAGTIMQKKIFARLRPEHKLRLIKALRREKIYTAMIGDGVNDLPAIKESDMGIAMEEGSQITKEVADIVLLKNKFSLLPQIFDEGNKIVNTVSSVAKLFLTKNFMVIYLIILSAYFSVHFPLTPRRVSLINIFSIGLPAFIIALKNSNVSKLKHFSRDLFSFVIISAVIIVGAAYAGEIFTRQTGDFTRMDIQMAMMSIMIIITSANFITVSIRKGEKNILLYLGYGLMIVLLYMFLAVTQFHSRLFHDIKEFYEIEYLKPEFLHIVLITGLISSVVLFVVQKIRERIIDKSNVKRER